MRTTFIVDTDWIADGAVTQDKLSSDQKRTSQNIGDYNAALEPLAIGAYLFAVAVPDIAAWPGAILPGSDVRPTNDQGSYDLGYTVPGSWRLMGYLSGGHAQRKSSIWLRVS